MKNIYASLMKEEQYFIWFTWKEIPLGWKHSWPKRKKEEMLGYIQDVWTDMRPKRVCDKMKD